MKNSFFTAARIEFFFLFLLLFAPSLGAEERVFLSPVATVKEIQGSLKINRVEGIVEGKVGDILYPGDQLETGARDKALLHFEDGDTLVKISNDTQLEIPPTWSTQTFLKQGLLWGKKTAAGSLFLIETPVLVTAVKGTEFFIEVKRPEETTVLTREGWVEVRFRGEYVEVPALTRASFEKGKPAFLKTVDDSLLAEWASRF